MLSPDRSIRTVTRDIFQDTVTLPLDDGLEVEFNLGLEGASGECHEDEEEQGDADYLRIGT